MNTIGRAPVWGGQSLWPHGRQGGTTTCHVYHRVYKNEHHMVYKPQFGVDKASGHMVIKEVQPPAMYTVGIPLCI
eukprot:8627597-Pyramimonas_sp.AAC.1